VPPMRAMPSRTSPSVTPSPVSEETAAVVSRPKITKNRVKPSTKKKPCVSVPKRRRNSPLAALLAAACWVICPPM